MDVGRVPKLEMKLFTFHGLTAHYECAKLLTFFGVTSDV